MNLIELQHALRQLRLGGIATVLETRLHQAQTEAMAPIDLISCLVADELTRRGDRLLERRRKQAAFRDPQKTLDHFDFNFNPKMNRSLVFDLATCAFIGKREDALFLGPGGTGKSHLAQAIGQVLNQKPPRQNTQRRNSESSGRIVLGFATPWAAKQNIGSLRMTLAAVVAVYSSRLQANAMSQAPESCTTMPPLFDTKAIPRSEATNP